MARNAYLFLLISIAWYSDADLLAQAGKMVTISLHQPKNYLYWGFENHFQISISGVKQQDIKLQSENITITGENGHYVLKVLRKQSSASLDIYENDDFIERLEFVCKPMPPAVMNLGSLENGQSASLAEILSDPKLAVNFSDKNLEATYTVLSYSVSFNILKGNGSKELRQLDAKGSVLTEEIQLALKNERIVGDIIFKIKYAAPRQY